jgi:hypothetical protein
MYTCNKTGNEYARVIDRALYEAVPKAVFAAIAVSLATVGGDYLATANDAILAEWLTLHENGIVPQKPPATFKAAEARQRYDSGAGREGGAA